MQTLRDQIGQHVFRSPSRQTDFRRAADGAVIRGGTVCCHSNDGMEMQKKPINTRWVRGWIETATLDYPLVEELDKIALINLRQENQRNRR